MSDVFKAMILMLVIAVTITSIIIWASSIPPAPPHEYYSYTREIEDKVVERVVYNGDSVGVSLCVFTDHNGVKHTYSDQSYNYREKACLLQIGDVVVVVYDETIGEIKSVTPLR